MLRTVKKEFKAFNSYMTADQRSLPDFFIAGVQKGGTTSFYTYLAQHPNILEASKKEIRFFESPNIRRNGLRWYKSHFPTVREKAARNAITGEATPSMYSYHAPRLIRETTPDAKIIFLLRNPVKRAFSHYKHNRRREGRESLTFGEAIREESHRIKESYETSKMDGWYDNAEHRRYSYVERGLYAKHLNRWYEFFSKDQILVGESECFYMDPQSFLDRTTDFLGLSRYKFECKEARNVGGYSEQISKSDAQHLEEIYGNQNERLFELIGQRFWDNSSMGTLQK